MSYCRFSSDDWRSDVYAYEDVGGYWQIHVAGNRNATGAPPIDRTLDLTTDDGRREWLDQHRRQMRFLEMTAKISIDHPQAGASYQCGSPGEAADRLEQLLAEGFHVPMYAIEELRSEQTQDISGEEE